MTTGLFAACGVRWSTELVGWGSPGPTPNREMLGYYPYRLDGSRGSLGKAARVRQTVNAWDVPAIYALHQAETLIYVGQAMCLGDRLLTHNRSDALAGRWDSFSWFSSAPVVEHQDGTLTLEAADDYVPEQKLSAFLNEMEAFAILLASPVDNRQQPDLGEHVWWFTQVPSAYADPTLADLIREIHEAVRR